MPDTRPPAPYVGIRFALRADISSRRFDMARYEATSKLTSADLIDKAAKHFAAVSGGLAVSSKTESSLCLESPEGFVTISVCPNEAKGRRNTMEIETDRYDYQVRSFLKSL
jgi:hypothetical protein